MCLRHQSSHVSINLGDKAVVDEMEVKLILQTAPRNRLIQGKTKEMCYADELREYQYKCIYSNGVFILFSNTRLEITHYKMFTTYIS